MSTESKNLICTDGTSLYTSHTGSTQINKYSINDRGELTRDDSINVLKGIQILAIATDDKNKLMCIAKEEEHYLLIQFRMNDNEQSVQTTHKLDTFNPLKSYHNKASYQLLRCGKHIILRARGQLNISPESTVTQAWFINSDTYKATEIYIPTGGRLAQIWNEIYTIQTNRQSMSISRLIVVDQMNTAIFSPIISLDRELLENKKPFELLDDLNHFRIASAASFDSLEILEINRRGAIEKTKIWKPIWKNTEVIYEDNLPILPFGEHLYMVHESKLYKLNRK